MLLLLTCATIADCDDFDEIVAWGSDHLVRANKSKRSVKTRRKSASWDTSYLLELLQLK
jgi:hypothetical protein